MKKKDFRNAPFKALKGASVFPEQQTAPQKPAKQEPPETEPDFLTAMEQLGVKPSGDARAEEPPPEPAKQGTASEDDEALFLDQLGRFDKRFRDELPVEDQPTTASPRRLRQLRRGRIAPEAELDLHGSDRDTALVRLGHFLDNARFHGLQCVLVITGRGNRSAEGPVVREAVERYLAGPGGEQVLEWARAPRQHGGDGALVIFLRSA